MHAFATRTLLAVALAGGAALTHAQQLVPAQSSVGFTFKQMGVPVDGTFRRFSAQITLDPKKPEAGRVAFAVEPASISLGSAEFDAEALKAPWFNAPKFPQASFASTSIKGLGGGRFEVKGKLTVKGAAQDVTIPVTLAQQGTTGTASGAFTIKRLAFKVGEGEWADTSMVADDVQVKFKLALTGLAP